MKLILVSGPWSSGTTAVAGALHFLGYTGFGPYVTLKDERTPLSYELGPFRELVLSLASEEIVAITAPSEALVRDKITRFKRMILAERFGAYDEASSPPIFLKYPLSALLIPWLAEQFELRLLVVARPMHDIEHTQHRRGWPACYGAAGAKKLYSSIFTAILENGLPSQIVQYPLLLSDPDPQLRAMAEFCGYVPDERAFERAEHFIRQSPAAMAFASNDSHSADDVIHKRGAARTG